VHSFRRGLPAFLFALSMAWSLAARAEAPRAPIPVRLVEVAVDGEIDAGLAAYLERVLDAAGPGDGVILRVNTFGGRIDAAVRIRDTLLRCKGSTMAFVEGRAISAGALISLGNDRLYMRGSATIGAATPVQLSGGEMKPVEAKVVSYFRKEMKATAEAKHRRGDLAEAMVDPAVEIEGLDGKESTLTLTTPEAIKHRFIDGEAATLEAALLAAGWPSVRTVQQLNWAERLARVLSDSRVSSLLMTLGMIGILIELWAPGHMLSGLFGAACLLLFFFGHYVVHLAGLGEILLFAAGVVAVVIEVAFIPGHGALGVVGALAILGSLVLAIMGRSSMPLEVSWALGTVTRALTMVSGALLASVAAMFLIARRLPSTRFGRALVLESAIKASVQVKVDLAGKEGLTLTVLRPAGAIDVDGQRYDVVTEGGFVEAGERVRVIKVEGARIVVARV